MKVKLFLCLSLCVSFLITNATATTSFLVSDPVGTYGFTISNIPDQQDLTGTMVVSRNGGAIIVKFSSAAGKIGLSDARLDGHQLRGSFDGYIMEGVVFKLEGKFTNSSFSGQINTEFGALTITADKK